MSTVLFLLVVLIVVAVIWGVGIYNSLITLRNKVDNAWSQIDVQLQRRLDLIPNLVETVKGYASHEQGTFEAVSKARSACLDATTPEDKMAAEGILSGTLKSLFAVSEAYPELKANTNFLEMQSSLSSTEDNISQMRHSYNDQVLLYNTAVQTFPTLLVANLFHFAKRENFDAAPTAETPPKVQF